MTTTQGLEGKSTSAGADQDPWELSFKGKRVVIGLGNPYMRDDGVGTLVAEELRRRELAGVVVYDCQALDLSLLWQFRDASKVVVVDAVASGGVAGSISTYAIKPRGGSLLELPSLHSLQLFDLFDLAGQNGTLPCPVTIVGVEPKDCSPGEGLTEEVSAAIPRLVDSVIRELEAR